MILSLLALFLMGAALMVTASYSPATLNSKLAMTAQIEQALQSLQTAAVNYYKVNSQYPPAASWDTALTPTYTFMPTIPAGMQLSYGTGAYVGSTSDSWLCLSQPGNAAQRIALQWAANNFSGQQVVFGSACGTAPSNATAGSALTFWLPLNP